MLKLIFKILLLNTFICVGGVYASTTQQQLQVMLRDLGHDPGPIDGDPGPRTEEALNEFFLKFDLEPQKIGFNLIDQVYQIYQAETGKNVVHLNAETLSSGNVQSDHPFLSREVSFPQTVFGDLKAIRKLNNSNEYWLNGCSYNDKLVKEKRFNGIVKPLIYPKTTEAGKRLRENLSVLTMDVMINDSSQSRERLTRLLYDQAKADSHRWFNGSNTRYTNYVDGFALKENIVAIMAAWSVLMSESNITADEFVEIDDWIWRILQRIDLAYSPEFDGRVNNTNHRFQTAVILMQAAIIAKSEYFLHRTLVELLRLQENQNQYGVIHWELARKEKALGYVALVNQSMFAIAEMGLKLGFDFYRDDLLNYSDAMNLYYQGIRQPALIEEMTGYRQVKIGKWRYLAAVPICQRLPELENCSRAYEFKMGYLEINMHFTGMYNSCTFALSQKAEELQ